MPAVSSPRRTAPAWLRYDPAPLHPIPPHGYDESRNKTREGRWLWTYASVKNVLAEEAYTGVLVNHRTETNNGKVKRLNQDEWYRHEGFFPVVIEREEWEQVQELLKKQARPANGNKAKHRYAGLLTCKECGNPFIPMIRYWNGNRRVEYVCRGYHRNGKSCVLSEPSVRTAQYGAAPVSFSPSH